MGPIHYLWLRRMHLVRRTLASAGSSGSTVTCIAADFGFWQMNLAGSQVSIGDCLVNCLLRRCAGHE